MLNKSMTSVLSPPAKQNPLFLRYLLVLVDQVSVRGAYEMFHKNFSKWPKKEKV